MTKLKLITAAFALSLSGAAVAAGACCPDMTCCKSADCCNENAAMAGHDCCDHGVKK